MRLYNLEPRGPTQLFYDGGGGGGGGGRGFRMRFVFSSTCIPKKYLVLGHIINQLVFTLSDHEF